MSKSALRLVMISAPFLLSACGEGWEAQRTDAAFPYGNQRTAGTGIAYVRAKMMPEKEIIAPQPVLEEVEIEVEVQPVLDAEEIFTEAQTKGGGNVKAVSKKAEEGKHSSNAHTMQGDANTDKAIKSVSAQKSSDIIVPDLSAEEYIAQAPKQIEIPQIDIAEIEPASGLSVDEAQSSPSYIVESLNKSSDKDMAGAEMIEETVKIYENKVAEPIKEIVVPKRDFFDFRSKGQESLDEIYSDPFVD